MMKSLPQHHKMMIIIIYPLVNEHNYGKSPFLMGNPTISMAIINRKLLVITRGYQNPYTIPTSSMMSPNNPQMIPPMFMGKTSPWLAANLSHHVPPSPCHKIGTYMYI